MALLTNITLRVQKRLFRATLVFWLPTLIFVWLAEDVLDKESILLDAPITNFIQSFSSEFLTSVIKFLTHGGDTLFLLIVTLLLAGYLYRAKRQRDMLAVLFSVGGAGIINIVLKLFFQRARPNLDLVLIAEPSFSFPSGHAMGSTALGLVVAIMLLRSRFRWVAVALCSLYISIIGISRVYLGVHYPSDVIAGWCISLAWVLVVYIALEHPAAIKRRLQKLRRQK